MYSVGTANKSRIIGIIRRSLGFVDRRLIDHGDRVAFIAQSIISADNNSFFETDEKPDMDKLLVLCLLHDIGAYKTEEIDEMVEFETDRTLNHSAYGYVFLSNTTPLGEYAQAILYHHTNYNKLRDIDCRYKTYAELIFLADRIDIMLQTRGKINEKQLNSMSGSVFSPRLTELFGVADKDGAVSGAVLGGSYKAEVEKWISNLNITDAEAIKYLNMLVCSIDFKSPVTVTHTVDTVTVSKTLGKLCGLDAENILDISIGALLHDIGKLAIPYSILESPGRLSAEQMNVMRRHVEISEEILRGIVPDKVCNIAVRHHEKLNGRGYPHMLTASELTLPEQIVAVADVFSALTSRRSYKEPFPKEKALEILRKMSDGGELNSELCRMVAEKFEYIIEEVKDAESPLVEIYERIKNQYEELKDRY